MKDKETIHRLQTQLSPDKHICSRCGYENNCRQEGCRIIREAIQTIEGLQMRADTAVSQFEGIRRLRHLPSCLFFGRYPV